MSRQSLHKYTTKLDRNNTNFTIQLLEHFKKTKWGDEYSFLKYYQNIVRSYINDVDIDARGALVQHEMGLGKSILAVSIAIDMMKERQPIILLTKSLEPNMRGAIRKYIKLRTAVEPDYHLGRLSDKDLDDWINHNFSFVSMNASNMLKQMGKASEGHTAEEFDIALEKKFGEVLKMASLDNKLLIVDEAHNLFRAITNGSKNAIGLYDLVMKARNLKCMFFTGTPIANDPFELVPCFNMLGSKFGKITLPENYKDFNKLFVDEKNGRIKNKEKFQNRILGLVSYVSHHSNPGKAFGVDDPSTKAEFPEERPVVVERVHMDPDQYVMYGLARDKEKEEGSGSKFTSARPVEAPSMTKPKSKAASTYRVKSRQLSNFCPPAGMREEKDPSMIPEQNLGSAKYRKMYENIQKHREQLGIVYSQFVGMGGLGTFSRYLDSLGWKRIEIGARKGVPKEEDPEKLIEELEKAGPGEQGELDEYEPDELRSPEIVGDEHQYFIGKGEYTTYGPGMPPADVYLNEINQELLSVPKNTWWLHGDDFTVRITGGQESAENNYINHTDYVDSDDESIETSDELNENNKFNENDEFDIFSAIEPAEDNDMRVGGADSNNKKNRTYYYAVISGEVDIADRTRIQDMFNDENNKHGGIIDLILLSSTGAEGLDLKNVRHIHIMEPYWNWGRVKQIIARGVRNDSHKALPKEEKDVTPYIYLAVPPDTERLPNGELPETTDTELYNESVINQVTIDSFHEAIREVAIECLVNGEDYCRVCNPSNQPLTTDDIERDIRATDPCSQVQEANIKAEEIIVDGVTYYYTHDPSSIYDYKVFVYDENINGYRSLKESDPRYIKIIEAIENEKGKK